MIRPKLLAMLCCESVAANPGSPNDLHGRYSLYGCFTRLGFREFPARMPNLSVFTRWGYGEGVHALTFRIRGGGDNETLCDGDVSAALRFDDPLAVVEAVIAVEDIVFPSPGTYFVEIALDGQPVDIDGTLFIDSI